MRTRLSARLLVLDPSGRILLFRFVHRNGALAGQDYWATPGGGVEDGETFEQAAIRELEEETGIRVRDIGLEVGRREFVLQLHNGERVMADERFFLVKLTAASLSRDGWTAQEVKVRVGGRREPRTKFPNLVTGWAVPFPLTLIRRDWTLFFVGFRSWRTPSTCARAASSSGVMVAVEYS